MRTFSTIAVLAMMVAAVGCQTTPETPEKQDALQAEADATLRSMIAQDASLRAVIDNAAGYAVFPNIGKGGAIVGGAYGRGVLYENGRPTGFVELNQGSVGALIGGETYSELIVFQTREALEDLRDGEYGLGAKASAVALKAGAAGEAQFDDGVAVFIQSKGGLMADLSLSGQKINYSPMGESR